MERELKSTNGKGYPNSTNFYQNQSPRINSSLPNSHIKISLNINDSNSKKAEEYAFSTQPANYSYNQFDNNTKIEVRQNDKNLPIKNATIIPHSKDYSSTYPKEKNPYLLDKDTSFERKTRYKLDGDGYKKSEEILNNSDLGRITNVYDRDTKTFRDSVHSQTTYKNYHDFKQSKFEDEKKDKNIKFESVSVYTDLYKKQSYEQKFENKEVLENNPKIQVLTIAKDNVERRILDQSFSSRQQSNQNQKQKIFAKNLSPISTIEFQFQDTIEKNPIKIHKRITEGSEKNSNLERIDKILNSKIALKYLKKGENNSEIVGKKELFEREEIDKSSHVETNQLNVSQNCFLNDFMENLSIQSDVKFDQKSLNKLKWGNDYQKKLNFNQISPNSALEKPEKELLKLSKHEGKLQISTSYFFNQLKNKKELKEKVENGINYEVEGLISAVNTLENEKKEDLCFESSEKSQIQLFLIGVELKRVLKMSFNMYKLNTLCKIMEN